MSHFSKPILVTFLGVPGSGKSFFSRNAAEKMKAVRLNSDAMRLSIFGSRENTKRIYESGDRKTLNSYVFGAMDYAMAEILHRGVDVFYDANSNTRSDRTSVKRIADQYGATAILVWVKTPREVAVRRGQDRDEAPDSPKKTEAEMHNVIDRMTANIEEPDTSENHVVIDGTAPFDEQYKIFEEYVSGLMHV